MACTIVIYSVSGVAGVLGGPLTGLRVTGRANG
jgi:hypothetical protein